MRQRLRVTIWTLVVPTAVSLAALAVTLSWRDRLPDPIATHWGPDGVDAFGHLTPHVVVPLGVMIPAFSLLIGAAALFLPYTTALVRTLAASALGFSVMISGVIMGGLAMQLDLPDAAGTPDAGGPFALSMFAAIVAAGVAAWLVIPRETT